MRIVNAVLLFVLCLTFLGCVARSESAAGSQDPVSSRGADSQPNMETASREPPKEGEEVSEEEEEIAEEIDEIVAEDDEKLERHGKLYSILAERGATEEEIQSVKHLHSVLRGIKDHISTEKPEEMSSSSSESVQPRHPQMRRTQQDAVHALREIMNKYDVIPKLKKSDAQKGKEEEEVQKRQQNLQIIADLRKQYLETNSVEEREKLMRTLTQVSAKSRVSMPNHGYRLHQPRPKPVLRDSEKLDYENSGFVHREEIRWIRQRILDAETDEERANLRQRLESMMHHARENRKKHLLDRASDRDKLDIEAAIESGNGVPEPMPLHKRLGITEPSTLKPRHMMVDGQRYHPRPNDAQGEQPRRTPTKMK